MSGAVKPVVFEQPESFAFNDQSLALVQMHIAKYPAGRQASAVMPLLDIAQRQSGGWLPQAAIRMIGELLDMPYIRVYEVATFYTMYNLQPVGKHFVQVCTTTPCWLRGSGDVLTACETNLGIRAGETTADGDFTLIEVECLGACVNAPMFQINDDYYEDLDADSAARVLETLKAGGITKPGPQVNRQTSAPEGGPTTLKETA
jgi:NADH-quinone oxidoreductase E subunit